MYISFDCKGRIREVILEILNGFGINDIEDALQTGLDANHRLCLSLRNSQVCFIDISEGHSDFALEAGFAQALKIPTLLLYERSWQAGRDPCVMAEGQKLPFQGSWPKKIKNPVSEFLRKSHIGGERRE